MGRLTRKLQTLISLPPQHSRRMSFSRLPKLNPLPSTHLRNFSSSSPCGCTAPKGHLPIRVVNTCTSQSLLYYIKAEHLNHPLITDLLERAAEEYGYSRVGALQVICDSDTFEDILYIINSKR